MGCISRGALSRGGYAARFAGIGFPGETYLTSYWEEGDKILLRMDSKERSAPIITNAAITLRG